MWVYVHHKTHDGNEAMIVPEMEYPKQQNWRVVRVFSILMQFVQLLQKL